jgi:multidrug efflux pump subunit AcrA (membrane-fusion protein)
MSDVAPCLRLDVSIVPQVFRGETSYVVRTSATQRYFRFGVLEMRVMRCFDGRRSLAEIVADLTEAGLRVSVGTVEHFARKLDEAGLLERTIAQRADQQLERLREHRARRWRPRLLRGELLRLRWSFGDPDGLLARLLPATRWMFTPGFVAASVVLFGAYLVVFGHDWDRFWRELAATYLPGNVTLGAIIVLWLTGGVVILIHELGHAVTCKYFGGAVRELGFMLLYFQPAFYCNVSDAWTFPERRSRLWVTAAGSWIQMVAASIAALVWFVSTPGTLLADVTLAVMIMGGVTTLLTNMNPLLPLDGYFALIDWLAIPNLRRRALLHYRWWIKRHLLGLDLPEPAASHRERRIFLTYGALAGTYVTLLLGVLAAVAVGWASRALGALGVALGVAALALSLRGWIGEWTRAMALALRARRARMYPSRTRWRRRQFALIAAGGLGLAGLVPWTITTAGPFVVHPLARSTVTAAAPGVVAAVLVTDGTRVGGGAPVARLVDRALERDELTQARLVDSVAVAEVRARAAGRLGEAQRLAAEHQSLRARLAALHARQRQLTLRAAIAGVVLGTRPELLVGRRLLPGDSLFTISASDSVELRVALGGGGATAARPGHVVHIFGYGEGGRPLTTVVSGISVVGRSTVRSHGLVEARIHLPSGGPWRVGSTGEASIELRRSNVLGALWWKARQLARTDLWL